VPGFGGSRVTLQDEFRILNNFYGGQLGMETGLRNDRMSIDVRATVALGQMQQLARIRGVTDSLSANGAASSFAGGLYALRSNIGRHERDDFAYIPNVELTASFQVMRHVKVSAGYSFLWVSTVSRAGEQIDPWSMFRSFQFDRGVGLLSALLNRRSILTDHTSAPRD
jgi:hypothetical protein